MGSVKTKEEILQYHYIHGRGLTNTDYVLKAMESYSLQQNSLKDERIRELEEALNHISEENYDDDDRVRHLFATIDRMKDTARKLLTHKP